ncbi:MAG: prolyl oligopeptidase family serine peptidase [Opitutaceae bacterium]|nr:prolyl oligopeptidase family serine peptidase [Opitutaceae bacterium]
MRPLVTFLAVVTFVSLALAQTPPAPPPPKRIPIPGITLTTAERAELTAGAAALGREITALSAELAGNPKLAALVPDVAVLHKAVDWALHYDEFMAPKEIAFARRTLDLGRERAAQLRSGTAPWLDANGLILRGHRSALDGSVQPYGLVVPESLKGATRELPLMVWLLGRGEKRTELAFLAERDAGPPQLTPKDTITVVPYGRFCNATKFAGEVDVFEALAAVRAQYRVDENRIAVGGFSMGGGSAWHLATHYSGLWCAATPGAGFAETPIFTKALSPNREPRASWEQLLWRQYEATGIAGNLFNLPTLAYTGENDGQKEASDLMEAAMAKEGLKLERFIGPQTAHKYHDETKAALTRRLEQLIAKGRDPKPREVWLQTYTLRYPDGPGVRIEGMGRHWELAEVRATLHDSNHIAAHTKNVEAISFPGRAASTVMLDGQELRPAGGELQFHREGDAWKPGPAPGLRKRPGLTGPVDDAFMAPFLFVRPSGKPLSPEVGAWVESELTAARNLWRDVFRGEARIVADRAVSEADIANHNLILWGDPSSNAVLARIVAQLPVQWDAKALVFRGRTYEAKHHAPILVFPNPLNPARYVVLNSGITFRTEGYGNNAHQTPKLPDWAIVDLRTPPGPRWPGKIIDAGFFDEQWR